MKQGQVHANADQRRIVHRLRGTATYPRYRAKIPANQGEITPQEFFDDWDAETQQKERLNPGSHDRLYAKLIEFYPGEGVDADTFFASE